MGSKFGRMRRKTNPTGLGCVWQRPFLGSSVSTRPYVAITFNSPGRCVATMTHPLHSHSTARRDFSETFWGSDSSVGSLFSRLLSLLIHHTKFFTRNLSPTRFPGLKFLPCSHACLKEDEVSRALGRPVCFHLSVPSLPPPNTELTSKQPNIGMTGPYAVQIRDICPSLSRYLNLTIWIGY